MDKFLSLFKPEEATTTIQKLAQKFYKERIWTADGMELSATSTDALQYFIRNDEKRKVYEDQFLIFGQATHSGSLYCFYKTPDAKNCDEWPILVLGDEGGAVILAKNIFDLMRFWTLNTVQPYIDSSDYLGFDLFMEDEDEDEEENEGNQPFKDWIQSAFGLAPLKSIEEAQEKIIKPAIEKYQHIITPIFKE